MAVMMTLYIFSEISLVSKISLSEVHILRRAVKCVAVFAHRVQPDFVVVDAALSDIAFHLVPQNLICREQVHRRHESGVGLVLLPDGFLECGLVLLAFESHSVITLLKFSLANKKSRLSFLSDADQTSFFKTIGFVAYLQKIAQIFYLHA